LQVHKYGMLTDFWTWLVTEARRADIDPSIHQGYESAFKDELQRLIRRTTNPVLRAKLEDMVECPVRDRRGRCRGFTEYIYAALVKNGIHDQYDIEAALQYVIEKMLMPRSETTGEERSSLFSGFNARPDETADFNPFQWRFMSFLQGAINNVRKGKVPRLRSVERRPQGSVSIGQGRRKEGDPATGISPDEIADRPSTDAELGEMVEDITSLLLRKQSETGLPLAGLFRAMMSGMNSQQQRARFGDRPARASRPIIVQMIRDYAEKTGNYRLLHLLGQFEGFRSNKPMPTSKAREKVAQPKLSNKDRDYRSMASVISRFNHPIGTAQLGSFRRRWLEYGPRDPSSGHPNRLSEVLSQMARDGVLRAISTRQGAVLYAPGPGFDEYAPSRAV
jgi:hypothetical protein